MKVMAFEKIAVRYKSGLIDSHSYIAAGDLCTVADKTLAGLYPVTYPTARGEKTRWVTNLKGFLCNQNGYGDLPYPAPGYPSATVKSGGCGLCAAVSTVGALTGKAVPVKDMRDLAISCGARVSGGTDMKRLTDRLCKTYGLKCTQSNQLSQLTEHLGKGAWPFATRQEKACFPPAAITWWPWECWMASSVWPIPACTPENTAMPAERRR